MSEPSRPGPRRAARQERSLTTVDAILRATELVLVQEGYEGTSTKAIADAAGVSVGSLYQYFSNRDALVAALIDRRYARLDAIVTQGLEQSASSAAEQPEPLAAFVETFVGAHHFEPALHRTLLECADRVGRGERARAFESHLAAALTQLARRHHLPDPESAAFVLGRALIAAVEGAVRDRLSLLEDGALTRELLAIAEGWARPRPAAPAADPADRLRRACEKHLARVLGPTLAVRALESVAVPAVAAEPEAMLVALAPILEVFLGVSHTRLVLAAIRKELCP